MLPSLITKLLDKLVKLSLVQDCVPEENSKPIKDCWYDNEPELLCCVSATLSQGEKYDGIDPEFDRSMCKQAELVIMLIYNLIYKLNNKVMRDGMTKKSSQQIQCLIALIDEEVKKHNGVDRYRNSVHKKYVECKLNTLKTRSDILSRHRNEPNNVFMRIKAEKEMIKTVFFFVKKYHEPYWEKVPDEAKKQLMEIETFLGFDSDQVGIINAKINSLLDDE